MTNLTDTQRKLAEQLLLSIIRHESVVEYNELANRIAPPIFEFVPNSVEIESDSSGYSLIDYR
jgi:hypothetical protein